MKKILAAIAIATLSVSAASAESEGQANKSQAAIKAGWAQIDRDRSHNPLAALFGLFGGTEETAKAEGSKKTQ